MSLLNIGIKGSYTGKGERILNDFLIPALSNSVAYDRITGYYTIESLLSIANGIDSLRKKHGKMRLMIGIHSVPEEMVEAVIAKEKLREEIEEIQKQIQSEICGLSDLLEKQKIVTIAWMIDSGLLSVKAAVVRGEGIFHPKTIILRDIDGHEVAAVGSSNETRNGLGGNFEQLMVATSWNNVDAVNDQKSFFDGLWNNADEDAYVIDITNETAEMIKQSLGNDYEHIKQMASCFVDDVFKHLADMPVNFFTSGNIPALYMHQERAVIDALSRWPIRVLFADEVGLGKTFEAAATITYLNKYCNVDKILILTPKSVLQQWQDELSENFGLDVWLFDSTKKQYVSSGNKVIEMGERNPLGMGSPDIMLMSSQFARGNRNSKGILSKKDTILPQLLVVDEAHSARISEDLSGKSKKTQVYKMIEDVSKKIPHIILATATPMQKKAAEYHAMLKLLGLPKIWENTGNFVDSLRFITADRIEDLTDANKIVSLLYHTNQSMRPDLSILTQDEKELLDTVIDLYLQKDNFENAMFVKNNWSSLRSVFVKLHPARLLTIRNTRRSLSEIGYKFPKRNLREKTLYDSLDIQMFYDKVNSYLSKDCFSVERELMPDKKMNTSFIRISYQQRVASSLYSCKKSLERRMEKIERLQDILGSKSRLSIDGPYEGIMDDFDDDDLLNMDLDDHMLSIKDHVNIDSLRRAINAEFFSLRSLISDVDSLLASKGDKKIDESIQLALQVIHDGDSVLLFSRYTDTVDSLIRAFDIVNEDHHFNYAIYTGSTAKIIGNGIEKECSKEQIKKALFAHEINAVFCSDAASEGLNLQAARVLINVDVPWTPARLEQRIGRVARLGQTAKEVDIYNVWYPNSVEYKMYGRIQKRLIDANIAIGEFPEVVAESIKHAILYDKDDDSLEMLNSLRNDLQKGALDELWAKEDKTKTQSDLIRKNLIEICKKEYRLVYEDVQNDTYVFQLPDGQLIDLAVSPGQKDTVNLKSRPFANLDKTLFYLKVIKNGSFDVGLADSRNQKMVKVDSVLKQFFDFDDQGYGYYDAYPTTLPDPTKLNLEFSVNDFFEDIPKYWIEGEDIDR